MSGGDAFGQFRNVGVRPPGGIVMQIMELPHARETAFQHLDIGQCGDGFDFLRREPVEEAVHHFAPGPEIVAFRPARFGQSRHAALKGVAVDIAEARDRDSMTLVTGLGRRIRRNGRDLPVFDSDSDVACPALRRQRRLKPQHCLASRLSGWP
jgi:hypothetical protein